MAAIKLCEHAGMLESNWGVHEQPGAFGPRAVDWEPIYSDEPEDVPQVTAARVHGYFPAHEAPLWCFLPAIWPANARAWVRDTRVRHLTKQCEGGALERLPWSAADYADYENDMNDFLVELGLSARPAGRIWLLHAPVPYETAQDLLDEIWADWRASGGLALATSEFVQYVKGRLDEVF
jgi:hypothetical protein